MTNPTEPATISWAELAGACGVITFFGAIATAYLRLAMGKAISDMRDMLLIEMKTNFVFKEAHRPEMHAIRKEISRNEADISKLSDRVDDIDLEQAKRHHE